MSRASVKGILREIEALPEGDRLALEREPARRLERQWKGQVARARRVARQRKLNQETIDRAVERRRYGR